MTPVTDRPQIRKDASDASNPSPTHGTQERHANRLNELADRLDTVHAELGSRIDSVDNRLDGVDSRLGGVENRLDEVLDIVRSLRG